MDQLTINQADLAERTAQVKIMGEIYQRCSRCLIWIDSGHVEKESEMDRSRIASGDILEFFNSFGDDDIQTCVDNVEASISSATLPPGERPVKRRRTSSISATVPRPPTRRQSILREHLLWFFEHPWFSRTWVYQEFVLARHSTFLIGDFELPGDAVGRMFTKGWWTTSDEWVEKFHSRLGGISRTRAAVFHEAHGLKFLVAAERARDWFTGRHPHEAKSKATTPLTERFVAYESLWYADILKEMGDSLARDDRDHVYAFVGLAPFLLKHLRVDYSLSVEEVFAAMMKALVKESKSLDFFSSLSYAADIGRSKLRLPSWVPDWTFSVNAAHILCHDNLFDASGPGFALPCPNKCRHLDPDTSAWNELEVAGKIIDVVQRVLLPFSAYQRTPGVEVDFRSDRGGLPWERATLEKFMAELSQYGIEEGEHSSMKDLLRTLFMDGARWAALASLNSGESLFRTGQRIYGLPHYKKTADLAAALTETEHPDLDALPHDATLEVLHELSKFQYHRRMGYCAGGRFALMPDHVERDDKIAILHGSRTPVVLRELRNGKYTVVGQCFYDGAMYGEMADLDDAAAEVFTLV